MRVQEPLSVDGISLKGVGKREIHGVPKYRGDNRNHKDIIFGDPLISLCCIFQDGPISMYQGPVPLPHAIFFFHCGQGEENH